MDRSAEPKFSRHMLVVLTPIGVAIGLYEAWQLAGGLVVLMAVQIAILTGITVALVRVMRRESTQQGADK